MAAALASCPRDFLLPKVRGNEYTMGKANMKIKTVSIRTGKNKPTCELTATFPIGKP